MAEEKQYTTVCKRDGVDVEMVQNSHGYFCNSWNGIKYPYWAGGQLATETEEKAIASCLDSIRDAGIED